MRFADRDGSIEGGSLAARVFGCACLVLVLCAAAFRPTGAAPAIPERMSAERAAPAWMRSETASRLDVGFPVLVPEWVPAPFDADPAVNTWSGHYGLYWVVTGGPPTFLEITGDAGGDIPDFSWYDRNVELTVNADVGGIPAYRDLTPIYDNVYWEVDDVVYTVSSQTMEGMTSLSVANALVRMEPPTPDPSVDPPSVSVAETVMSGDALDVAIRAGDGATLSADLGTFSRTGEDSVDGVFTESIRWEAPEVQNERSVTFTLTDPGSGEWLAAASTVILAPADPVQPLALDCPVSVTGGGTVTFTASGGGDVVIEAQTGTFPAIGANLDFDGAGTARLVGALPASGPISFTWLAPETAGSGGATLYLSGMSGASGDACTIQVSEQVSGAPAAPGATATAASPQDGPVTPGPASRDPTATAGPGGTDTGDPTTQAGRATATPRPRQDTVGPHGDGTGVAGGDDVSGTSDGDTTTTRGRTRYPTSDGTGGVSYPRYDGVDTSGPAVGGMIAAPAPTNAPMPDAPATLMPTVTASGIALASADGSSGAGPVALWLLIGGLAASGLVAAGTARGVRRRVR
ncbi:MAG: hypothetical protein WKF80_10800 [Thermomicrobiales bacterium]